jgi:uncharacterized protein (TIGR03083 family)
VLETQAARDAIAREWGAFIEQVTSTGPEVWDRPTRCSGWTVADLARHAYWGTSMEADALARRRLSIRGPAEGREADRSRPPEEIINGLRVHRRQLLAEIDGILSGDGLDRDAPMPYGPVPVAIALQVFVMEAGVHTSDLAAAVDVNDGLADDVAAATWVVLAGFVPLLAAGAPEVPPSGTVITLAGATSRLVLTRGPDGWVVGPTDDAPDAVISGDDSTVLLFALGRRPATDAGLQIAGDADLAARFKRYVPGP